MGTLETFAPQTTKGLSHNVWTLGRLLLEREAELLTVEAPAREGFGEFGPAEGDLGAHDVQATVVPLCGRRMIVV